MCEKRIADLKHLATLYRKRTHTELSSELPKQPTGGAPYLNKAVLRKANTISKVSECYSKFFSPAIILCVYMLWC